MLNRSEKIEGLKDISRETLEKLVFQLNPECEIFEMSKKGTLAERLGINLTNERIRNNGDYRLSMTSYLRNTEDINLSVDMREELAKYIEEMKAGVRDGFTLDIRKDGKSGYLGKTDEEALHIHIDGVKGDTTGNYTIIFSDETAVTKARDELIEANEKLSHLATLGENILIAAHQLKSPLVSIGGFARRISKKTNDLEIKGYVKELILPEVIRSEKMIHDLMEYSRQQVLNEEYFNINDLVTEVYETVRLRFPEMDITLELAEQMPMIKADRKKLFHAYSNLSLNAAEKIDEKKAESLRLRTRAKSRYAVFEAIDDGYEKIPEDELEKIFDLFYTTKDKGTGLGLPIVKKMIELHNGYLKAKSRHRCTTFAAYIPLK